MKDRVIRVALAFALLVSTVQADPSSAATVTDTCPTAVAAASVPTENLPPEEMLTANELHNRAVELETVFREICEKKACTTEQKKQAFWKVALGATYRWTLRPILTRAAPVGLLVGAVIGTMTAMYAIDQNFSEKSAATAGLIFGLLTTQFVNGMMAPAMTPLVSKMTQLCWTAGRFFKGTRTAPYQVNPAELDELYALSQHLVRLTAQAARSTWYEHAALAEARHMEAADKWLGNSLNRETVVPNILAMSLRRLTKRFPEIDLLGDLEIEREFRINFRNQFTLAALQPSERVTMAGSVLAALEQLEWEVEEEEMSANTRAYFVRLLDALIVHPQENGPTRTKPTEESKTGERA